VFASAKPGNRLQLTALRAAAESGRYVSQEVM